MTKANKIPKQADLYWPVIQAFKELHSSRQEQLVEKVCTDINLSERDISILHGKGPTTEISYRISWVKDSLKRVGILETPERGLWTLTKKGRHIVSEKEAKGLRSEVRALIKKQRKITYGTKKRASRKSAPDDQGPEYLDEAWKGEILDAVRSMTPSAFEWLATLLLSKSDFHDLVVTQQTRDGGIDVQGFMKEGKGIVRRPVLVQCKRYNERKKVAPKEIRDFRGAVEGRAEIGIFITCGKYSDDARKEAVREGAIRINLVDGEQLADMLKKAELGVKVEEREYVTVKPEFFAEIE